MKRLLLTLLIGCLSLTVTAQPKPKNELKKNVLYSASNCLAYPAPAQRKLTPAPDGKVPFHISHLGRHGSRYLINARDYAYVLGILSKADNHGKLSELGKDVYRRVKLMNDDAEDRLGDLTELGVSQQNDIARRMVERFPNLFQGEATVNARSTVVLRCVFSMENSLFQLLRMNPKLKISHEASRLDMHLLNPIDKHLASNVNSAAAKKSYDKYCRKHQCWQRAMGQLFSDKEYFEEQVNGERLNYYLFRMAGSVQNTDMRRRLTLYDIFNDDEIYRNWQMENAYWFLGYGNTPLNGGQQPFIQRTLLRSIIHEADSCIDLPQPGVMLRWSHETAFLPLVCLMDVNGYGQSIDDLDQLEQKGWVNYRIFPMSANLQLVFYRRNVADKDVLVKVLLNESEATLPLKSDFAPYYRWSEVRDYWLKKLDSFKETE